MKLMSGHVLLRLMAADKQKLFQEDMQSGDNIITLFKDIEQEEGLAGAFEQTVQSGEVVAVAPDVKHIQPGDIAILDYIVDTLKENIVYQDLNGKLVCVDTRTEFHDDDKMVYANGKTKNDMFVWQKGDVDQASLIYGVFRDDQLIPNPPYVICEHKDFQLTSENKGGLTYTPYEEGCRIRRVLVPNAQSDPEVLPGTYVVVEDYCLYEREMDGKKFDVIMDGDIEVSFQ